MEGFFYVLFSGSNISAYATQIGLIHSISGNGRKPVKKIPAYATLLLAMKPEVESPLNRISITYNRKGHRTFADDRADFNSNRRFYHWTSDFGEYLEGMADRERNAEVKTVADLLDEIENETLYRALLTVDRRTLQIILLKMQGYSTKEIAPLVGLTTGAIYARLDHLCKKLRKIL